MFDVIVTAAARLNVTAALRARELGASVALLNAAGWAAPTNDGCVPTRVLAHAARLMRETAQHERGLLGERQQLDFARLIGRRSGLRHPREKQLHRSIWKAPGDGL